MVSFINTVKQSHHFCIKTNVKTVIIYQILPISEDFSYITFHAVKIKNQKILKHSEKYERVKNNTFSFGRGNIRV